jgi:competence protein ComEC
MHRPLVGIVLSYLTGIFLGFSLNIPFRYIYPILLLSYLLILFLLRKKAPLVTTSFIYLSLFFLGMGAYSLKANPVYPNHITNFIRGEEVKRVSLEGTIIKDPEVRITARKKEAPGNEERGTAKEKTVLILKAERIKISLHPNPLPPGERRERGSYSKVKAEGKWEKVVGLVQVSVLGKDNAGDYGQRIKITRVSLRKPPLPRNPGEFNYRRYLARKGIYALMNIRRRGQIKVLGRGQVNPFLKMALIVKERMKRVIEDTMEYPQTVLLEGILLGERGGIPPDLKETFTQTGTVHILAISGLHVGLVILIFFVLFRALRIPGKVRAIFTLIVLLAYALVTGGRPPVIRASIIAAAVLVGMIVNRESDLLNSLSLAALVILALNPLELFDSGFQLSFAAVLAIITLAPRLNALFLKDPSVSTLKRYLLQSFSVILAAQIGIIPLVAYYYGLFTPIALVANFLIIPLLGIVVALGFSTYLSGVIFLPLAELFGAANGMVLTLVVRSADFLSQLPFSFIYVGRPRIAVVAGYYLITGAIFYVKRPSAKK